MNGASGEKSVSKGYKSLLLGLRSDTAARLLKRNKTVVIRSGESSKDQSEAVVFKPELGRRNIFGKLFYCGLCVATGAGVVLLCLLLSEVAIKGMAWVDWQFITSFPSRFPARAGIYSALFGTLWVVGFTALFSIPVGVGAAIYLEEYAKRGRLSSFIEVNIANLAGVPSIIYGLLGLVVFVRGLMLGRSVVSGALTMSLLVLPIIIVASREALKSIPHTIREAAYSLGATRWQTVRAHVLPASLPGILTGIILAVSRAIGETAPLIMVGAVAYIAFVPDSVTSAFTVLPIQIFDWTSRPQESFHELAAGGILVLLVVLLSLNGLAIFIRNKYERKLKW